jgi:hypothetical protein
MGKRYWRGAYKIPALRKKINRKAGKKLLETFGGELKIVLYRWSGACAGRGAIPARSPISLRYRLRTN